MKRIGLVVLLICAITLCGCSGQPSVVSRQEDSAPLWAGADRWVMPEGFGADIDDFHFWNKEKDFSKTFDAVDVIKIEGANELPIVTNQTPLEDMIVSINGEIADITGSSILYPSSFGISVLYASGKTYSKLPIVFLRQNESGNYYTVCKVETGGYLYLFFDRGLTQDKRGGPLKYASEDVTDLCLSGRVYAEEIHAYSEFKDIQVGDYMSDLIEIDHSFVFYKDNLQAYMECRVKWLLQNIPDLRFTNESCVFDATILLEDGLLQVKFQYDDPAYEGYFSDTFLDEEGNIKYHYDMNNLKITAMEYFPDHQTKNFSLDSDGPLLIDYTYDRTILPIDYPKK